MTHLTVSRPFTSRLLWKLIRQTVLDGGYSLSLKVGEETFKTPVVNGMANSGPDIALLELYSCVLPGLNGIFLDVGANVGQTLLAVRSVAPEMPYVGLEPNVSCLAYLKTLIRRNDIRDVVVLPVGLMDQTGFLELHQYFDSETDSTASLIKDFRPDQPVAGQNFVPTFSWADIETLLKGRSIAFVKVDVEGAELEVLRTLEAVLQTQRPWLGIEILPAYKHDYGDRFERQQAIENLFRRTNHIMLRVKKGENQHLTHLERIEFIGIHDRVCDSDYLIVPEEDLGKLSQMNVQ